MIKTQAMSVNIVCCKRACCLLFDKQDMMKVDGLKNLEHVLQCLATKSTAFTRHLWVVKR